MITRPAVRFEYLARLGLLLLLAVACWRVLQPFLPAILFSLAIAIATWPAYQWLVRRLGGRRTLASAIASVVVALLVIAPTLMLVISLRDGAVWFLKLLDEWRASGPWEAPAWITGIPVLGKSLGDFLRDVSSGNDRVLEMLSDLAEPARRFALAGGRAIGQGIGQAMLAALLLFFMYRDGDLLGRRLETLTSRVGGDQTRALLTTAQDTIGGVMFSVLGTAFAQAAVATIGFAIVGAPNPVLLGALTFVLSLVPIGPPLIWGGVTLWLVRDGHLGWALFMALYGFFGISLVDNVIKPLLISRSSRLPFALTFMGVLGGVLAFGVAGIFIGPTALALAMKIGEQRFFTSNDDSTPI